MVDPFSVLPPSSESATKPGSVAVTFSPAFASQHYVDSIALKKEA